MADENTTNYSFTKPEVGASEDSWGDKLNANWDSVDSLLSGNTDLSSLSISGDLTVDTDTLYVDSANNRVGIGTSSPSEALNVNGDIAAQVDISYGSSADKSLWLGATNVGNGVNNSQPLKWRWHVDGDQNGQDLYLKFTYDNGASNAEQTAYRAYGNTHVWYVGNTGSEAMRIDSSGNLLVGKTAQNVSTVGVELLSQGFLGVTRSGARPLLINRQTDDGDLVEFQQGNTKEGSISVSGTTVSYNGGHLSRWSRLPDGTDDTHIYKGTVMTNLDEMCEWRDEQGDLEDNEQLNKTTVSTQEGDPNVAGLFVAWDEDDDWGDYYLAMTGDLVVRIAQGVTVQRGDLLMSAGDGTAKPQGDDIVRSKTVAKVTSTNISHTYPDGSYAVPCVVMAC